MTAPSSPSFTLHTPDPMTTPPNTLPLDAPPPRPYDPPSLISLGTVESVTAGPIANGGNLDQLVGLAGGFNQSETTS